MEGKGIPMIEDWRSWIHWIIILVVIGAVQLTIMARLNDNIGWMIVLNIPFTIIYSFIVYRISSIIKRGR